ncbi:MAG: aspartyl-phosphate phosphatase Spo0E family protein [Firmicutes bacterium]|nr:aspartyl-phosphate phosphatase Spo0E family protein [Bacillota bacterium]
MSAGRLLVRIERLRRKLLTTNPANKAKLLRISQEMDDLINQYYQARNTGKMVG